jgi:hypothetical protein
MTAEKLCEQVLRIITEGNLSFVFAENSEFASLLKHAYLDIKLPQLTSGDWTIENQCYKAKRKVHRTAC